MNVESSMCASSDKATHWDQINWSQCARRVRRLQARIVKATTGSARAGLRIGLSRMRGNSHVRFSGEGVAATLLPYPTGHPLYLMQLPVIITPQRSR